MTTTEPEMPAMSLEEWRRVFQLHPWHFYQLANDTTLKVTQQSDPVLFQYAWQGGDAVGRSDIVEAIRSAERKLRQALRYRVGPQYVESVLAWPGVSPRTTRGGWQSVQLEEGEIRAIGVESRTLIGTPAVVYSDPDGDGVSELATITVATAVTDASQIAVYFQASDRLNGDDVSEVYRIRPVKVAISGGTATITAPAWLFVRPVVQQGVGKTTLNPATAGVLATAVDVYQRTTSGAGTTVSTSQGVITWETRPCHGWWCCCGCAASDPYAGSPYDPASVARAVARVGIRDARLGIVTPAEASYDSATGVWSALDWSVCWPPDRVTVRYLAGLPGPDGQQIDRAWQVVVARMAAAELGRPIAAKNEANRELYRWQFDVSRVSGANDEAYAYDAQDLVNPFGTRRGHIDAWKYVQRVMQTPGILAG